MVEETGEEAEEQGRPKKKHTPSRRGHSRKSLPSLKSRFQKKAARRRVQEAEELRRQWEIWESLPDYVKKKRRELEPKGPKPQSES